MEDPRDFAKGLILGAIIAVIALAVAASSQRPAKQDKSDGDEFKQQPGRFAP